MINHSTKIKYFALSVALSMPFVFSGCAAVVVGAGAGTAGAVIGSDSRTIESMTYDESIEQKASEILKTNKLLSDSKVFNVSVVSMSGNVLLVGQTTDTSYLKWCINEIQKLDYVRKVYNYVENKPPVSASTMASDTYITTKVKSKLLFGENIKSGRFKVVTEDGVVYLMGYVTEDEANRAVNLTTTVDGVKSIYKIFDYIVNYPTQQSQGYKNDPIDVYVVDSEKAVNTSNSSTYVAPASVNDNGGAVLVEDNSLLAPSSSY